MRNLCQIDNLYIGGMEAGGSKAEVRLLFTLKVRSVTVQCNFRVPLRVFSPCEVSNMQAPVLGIKKLKFQVKDSGIASCRPYADEAADARTCGVFFGCVVCSVVFQDVAKASEACRVFSDAIDRIPSGGLAAM